MSAQRVKIEMGVVFFLSVPQTWKLVPTHRTPPASAGGGEEFFFFAQFLPCRAMHMSILHACHGCGVMRGPFPGIHGCTPPHRHPAGGGANFGFHEWVCGNAFRVPKITIKVGVKNQKHGFRHCLAPSGSKPPALEARRGGAKKPLHRTLELSCTVDGLDGALRSRDSPRGDTGACPLPLGPFRPL